jgi:hypothetical protein
MTVEKPSVPQTPRLLRIVNHCALLPVHMASKHADEVENDALGDEHKPLARFKLKIPLSRPKAPTYNWIIYANDDRYSLDRSCFYLRVSKDTTVITSTQQAALEMVAIKADELAAKYECERSWVRDAGQGVRDNGDMCCDVIKRHYRGGNSVFGRVYAWKVKVSE